ncbi:TY-Chap domain-containing protein [Intrasporangium flavum]|uniref:TY-Chap domain-containing protein n=1 Tax=Intrasporangium flavum TaxID=1428657 RepID=UPI00096FC8D9|nr:hypothetical protein [Intrasporangium flavum]
MTDPLEETWEAWTARIAADLTDLAEDDWMTFTVHVPSRAAVEHADPRPRRGWRRGAACPGDRPSVPDVLVQASRVGGVVALECIGDTEFEGLTDLTRDQQTTLTGLGWEREGPEPEFGRTFTAGADAARLVHASLALVLGATSPADVDVRRAPRPSGTAEATLEE